MKDRLAHLSLILVLALLLALAPALSAQSPDDTAQAVVHFYYFQDPGCESCHTVFAEIIEPLLHEYGDQLVMELRGIDVAENFELMLNLEQSLGGVAGGVPEIIIGEHVLAGHLAIQQSFQRYIDEYLAQGGVALPVVAPTETASPETEGVASAEATKCVECEAVHAANRTAVAASRATEKATQVGTPQAPAGVPAIPMAYFYQLGCDVCERSEHDLAYIKEQYPQVAITRYDIADEAALNQYLCQAFGVPEDKHLTAPALFIGESYLLDDAIRARAIEALIAPYLVTGAPEPWEGFEAEDAELTIVERFRSFGLLTVIGAGLIDGVNPCAFATMIFLISYLSVRKRKGRDLLLTGAAFSLGVFLTYLGVGFGFLKFLAALPFINTIGRWLYAATALLCLVLAVGSIMDYVKAKQGRLHEMSFRLPDRLQRLSKKLIREGTSARRFVLSAFLLGMGVSVVELACTGQVYLPTIVYVLGVPALQAQASLALVLYNLMFILPLIAIFVLVYLGTTSQQLVGWLNRHAATVKLAMATLFLVLAAWLIYSVLSL